MFKRGLVLSLVLCMASVVNAGSTSLELRPSAPADAAGYARGEVVDVEIVLLNGEGAAFDIRLAQVDFAASDAQLSIADFGIDLSSLLADALYTQFPTDMAGGNTIANVTYSGSTPTPGFILNIGEGGELSLGTATVTLPDADGTYRLDVVNGDAPNNNSGARFDYGFDSRTILWPVGGGQTDLTVVPEPATLALLGVGGIAMLRRRRKA